MSLNYKAHGTDLIQCKIRGWLKDKPVRLLCEINLRCDNVCVEMSVCVGKRTCMCGLSMVVGRRNESRKTSQRPLKLSIYSTLEHFQRTSYTFPWLCILWDESAETIQVYLGLITFYILKGFLRDWDAEKKEAELVRGDRENIELQRLNRLIIWLKCCPFLTILMIIVIHKTKHFPLSAS